jgi:hypothetical protein
VRLAGIGTCYLLLRRQALPETFLVRALSNTETLILGGVCCSSANASVLRLAHVSPTHDSRKEAKQGNCSPGDDAVGELHFMLAHALGISVSQLFPLRSDGDGQKRRTPECNAARAGCSGEQPMGSEIRLVNAQSGPRRWRKDQTHPILPRDCNAAIILQINPPLLGHRLGREEH